MLQSAGEIEFVPFQSVIPVHENYNLHAVDKNITCILYIKNITCILYIEVRLEPITLSRMHAKSILHLDK